MRPNQAQEHAVVTLWMYPIAHIVVASGAAWSAERVAWRLFEPRGARRPETETVLWPFYGWTFQHSTTPYFPVYLLLKVLAAAALYLGLRRLWRQQRLYWLLSEGEI